MTNSLGVAEDFGPERGQPPGFHVGPIPWSEPGIYSMKFRYIRGIVEFGYVVRK